MSWLDSLKRMINEDPEQRDRELGNAADRMQNSLPHSLQGTDQPFGSNPELMQKIKNFFSPPPSPSPTPEPDAAHQPVSAAEQADRIARHKAVIQSIIDDQEKAQAQSAPASQPQEDNKQEEPQTDAAQQRAADPDEYKNKLDALAQRYKPTLF